MTDRQTNEALERLNRGIQQSRRAAQRQGMQATQEYFGDFVETLKDQMNESRSNLKDLPEQVPGGQEESFQSLYQELMSSYSKVEECLDEANKKVAGVNLERLRRRKEAPYTPRSREVKDTDAAQCNAGKREMDFAEIEGTSAEDLRSGEERQSRWPEATDAAHREARRRGIDLSEVEATGVKGQIIISDVVEFAETASGSAVGGSAVGGSVADLSGPAQVNDTRKEAGPDFQDQIHDGLATDPSGSALEEMAAQVGWTTRESGNGEEPLATNAARRKAQERGIYLSDVDGTGSGGQITVGDVTGFMENDRGAVGQASGQTTRLSTGAADGTASAAKDRMQEAVRQTDVLGEPVATNAARSRAEKLGVELSRIDGSGVKGLITMKDVQGVQGRD